MAPAPRGAVLDAEHELEDGLLAEAVGNDFEAPAFLDEQAFRKVDRGDRPKIRNGHHQARKA